MGAGESLFIVEKNDAIPEHSKSRTKPEQSDFTQTRGAHIKANQNGVLKIHFKPLCRVRCHTGSLEHLYCMWHGSKYCCRASEPKLGVHRTMGEDFFDDCLNYLECSDVMMDYERGMWQHVPLGNEPLFLLESDQDDETKVSWDCLNECGGTAHEGSGDTLSMDGLATLCVSHSQPPRLDVKGDFPGDNLKALQPEMVITAGHQEDNSSSLNRKERCKLPLSAIQDERAGIDEDNMENRLRGDVSTCIKAKTNKPYMELYLVNVLDKGALTMTEESTEDPTIEDFSKYKGVSDQGETEGPGTSETVEEWEDDHHSMKDSSEDDNLQVEDLIQEEPSNVQTETSIIVIEDMDTEGPVDRRVDHTQLIHFLKENIQQLDSCDEQAAENPTTEDHDDSQQLEETKISPSDSGDVTECIHGSSQILNGELEISDTEDNEHITERESELVENESEIWDSDTFILDIESKILDDAEKIGENESHILENASQIEENVCENFDYEPEVEENESNISDHRSQLEENESDISDHQSQLEENESDISDHQSQLEENESDSKPVQKDSHILDQEKQITENDSQILVNETQSEGNDSETLDYEPKIEEKESNIVGYPSQFEENEALGSESELVQNESQIFDDEEQIVDYVSHILEDESQFNGNESDILDCESNTEGNALNILDYESQIDEKESQILDSESDVVNNESQIWENESDLLYCECETVADESNILGCESHILENESEFVDCESELAQNKSQIGGEEMQILNHELQSFQDGSQIAKESQFDGNKLKILDNESQIAENVLEGLDRESQCFQNEFENLQSGLQILDYESRVVEKESRVVENESDTVDTDSEIVNEESYFLCNDSPQNVENDSQISDNELQIVENYLLVVDTNPKVPKDTFSDNESNILSSESKFVDNVEAQRVNDESQILDSRSQTTSNESRLEGNGQEILDLKPQPEDDALQMLDIAAKTVIIGAQILADGSLFEDIGSPAVIIEAHFIDDGSPDEEVTSDNMDIGTQTLVPESKFVDNSDIRDQKLDCTNEQECEIVKIFGSAHLVDPILRLHHDTNMCKDQSRDFSLDNTSVEDIKGACGSSVDENMLDHTDKINITKEANQHSNPLSCYKEDHKIRETFLTENYQGDVVEILLDGCVQKNESLVKTTPEVHNNITEIEKAHSLHVKDYIPNSNEQSQVCRDPHTIRAGGGGGGGGGSGQALTTSRGASCSTQFIGSTNLREKTSDTKMVKKKFKPSGKDSIKDKKKEPEKLNVNEVFTPDEEKRLKRENSIEGTVVKDSKRAPQLLHSIQADLFPDHSGNLKLYCHFGEIHADATITWTKDSKLLARLHRSSKDDSPVSLAIVQTSKKDQGLYNCTLKNAHGKVSTEFHLTEEVLDQLTRSQEVEGGEEIEFNQLFFREDFISDMYFGGNLHGRIATEDLHFGEGVHRKAFRSKVMCGLFPVFNPGHLCVLKVHNAIAYGTKNNDELVQKNYKLAVQECYVQNTAREYAKIYAAEAEQLEEFGKVPEIIPIFLIHRPANNIPYATVEEELIGDFVKYSIKDGKEINVLRKDSEAGQKCCTFQHWVYERTNGNLLVTDMQGVGMKLTDVGIATMGKGYKGFKGNCSISFIDQFKALHQCNKYCEILGLKSLRPNPPKQKKPNPLKETAQPNPSTSRKNRQSTKSKKT
ncbi:alpha-protein kinase 2 [Engystomops pustulosus]|uniref:alpha-protein kinase 2 n=1 Tax=Engystomops pustulosus TaxID=76066 RepID=UPI003AFB378F